MITNLKIVKFLNILKDMTFAGGRGNNRIILLVYDFSKIYVFNSIALGSKKIVSSKYGSLSYLKYNKFYIVAEI